MNAQPQPAATLMERLRAVHLRMVDAVLGGDGLEGVAELAAGETGGRGGDRRAAARRRGGVRPGRPTWPRCAATSASGRAAAPVAVPAGVVAEVPIAIRRRATRRACCCSATEEPAPGRAGVPARGRGRVPDRGRRRGGAAGGRAEPARLVPGGAARRATTWSPTRCCGARRGWAATCRSGAVALCAELSSDRPRHVVATIAGEHPGALAQHMEGARRARLRAAARGGATPRRRWPPRGGWPARLQRHGTVGVSSLLRRRRGPRPRDPGGRAGARRPAPLATSRSTRTSAPGTYRLLFRVLASHPEEVRSFYEDTVAPLVGV